MQGQARVGSFNAHCSGNRLRSIAVRNKKPPACAGGSCSCSRVAASSSSRLRSFRPCSAATLSKIFSASRQTLEQLLDAQIKPDDLRVYVGHSDWRAGQLEGELAQGNWHLTQADNKLVFAKDAAKVWPRLINRWEPLGIMAGAAKSGPVPGAVESRTLPLADGTELSAEVYPAVGSSLVLWLPSEAGLQPGQATAAAGLAAAGLETGIVDVLAARCASFGAADWDDPTMVAKLCGLLAEQTGTRDGSWHECAGGRWQLPCTEV